MADIINQTENTETGKSELWITIKDASDLLGISERHTWRIALQNAWKTQKLLNNDRKKTYILRADVEKYYQAERERQRLEQLRSSDNPATSDIGVFDKSDIKNKPKSDIKNLPILLSDYRNMMVDLQKKQEQLIKNATLWKTTAIWLTILAVFIGGFLGFSLYDSRKMMSDIKREMSDRINDLSDKATEAQKALLSTKDALFQKEIWINRLEQTIPKEKIEQLKVEEKKEE
ncbi:MAG: hypothetical protein KKI12_09070 [Proteobacteria bacterium]|nr:hypothetical protein [Pseudomonadota bacterium]MBU4288306.1 hypothetical protein [Pseudomonadota bacterium]MBU4403941.1 hypothetical protein [Actinomycetota bacterium]MCG2713931.1 hypothetical protein [Candidatus Omnitrophota bacterium]